MLGSVKIPYKEIKRRIIEFDEENLTSGLLEQLIKYMPSPEEINKLAGLKDEYDDLAEPEQFCVVVRLGLFLFHFIYCRTRKLEQVDLTCSVIQARYVAQHHASSHAVYMRQYLRLIIFPAFLDHMTNKKN